jgi:hypothetical protein
MSQHYIIDGYNLMHFSEGLVGMANRNLESGRDELINRVVRWAGTIDDEVTIIFDGQGRATGPTDDPHGSPGVTVLFSSKQKTADDIIERAVYKAPRKEAVIVVSADRGIKELCLGMGALLMSPENFWTITQQAQQTVKASIKTHNQTTDLNRMEDRLDADILKKLNDLKDKLS